MQIMLYYSKSKTAIKRKINAALVDLAFLRPPPNSARPQSHDNAEATSARRPGAKFTVSSMGAYVVAFFLPLFSVFFHGLSA